MSNLQSKLAFLSLPLAISRAPYVAHVVTLTVYSVVAPFLLYLTLILSERVCNIEYQAISYSLTANQAPVL